MDPTTPSPPEFAVPFVINKDEGDKDAGQKDAGKKDGVPQAAPSREFPLMSGEETTDPVPCGSAVVWIPSDGPWDLKRPMVYYRRAVVNICDRESHLKLRDVKMPIAVNSHAWDLVRSEQWCGAQLSLVEGVRRRSRSDSSCRPP